MKKGTLKQTETEVNALPPETYQTVDLSKILYTPTTITATKETVDLSNIKKS
jgi:hypothetical protein